MTDNCHRRRSQYRGVPYGIFKKVFPVVYFISFSFRRLRDHNEWCMIDVSYLYANFRWCKSFCLRSTRNGRCCNTHFIYVILMSLKGYPFSILCCYLLKDRNLFVRKGKFPKNWYHGIFTFSYYLEIAIVIKSPKFRT